MADEPIGGGAAVAEAAPAAAPAGGESAAAPSTSGGESAAPAVSMGEDESPAQFLMRATKEAAKPAAEAPAEPEKPAEAPPVEKKEEVPAEPAEGAAPAEEEEEPFELEPAGPLPPKDLAAKLKEDPALAAAIDKAGLKPQLFEAARLAQQVSGFKEVFADVEAAKYAAQASETFGKLGDKFTAITDTNSVGEFLQELMPLSYVLDEEGNPKMGPDGKTPLNDGSVGKFMDNVLWLALEAQEKFAKEKNDEDTVAAIELLKARTGRGPASTEEEQLTDAQKQEAQRLKAERESITREKSEAAKAKSQEFETSVSKEIDSEVDKLIDKILAKVDAPNFNEKRVREDIREKVFTVVAQRKDFMLTRDNLMRRDMSEKVRKERVALAMRTVTPLLYGIGGKPGIAAEVLKAEGVKLKAAQAEKSQKQATREEQSRSEQRGAGRPAAPQSAPSDQQLFDEATKELTAANGREPSMSQVMQLAAQKKAKFASR